MALLNPFPERKLKPSSLYSPFSEDSDVFVGEKGRGKKSTDIMFVMKMKVGAWMKIVSEAPGQKRPISLVRAGHGSHPWKRSHFWLGAYGFIYYCSVIRIEPGYSNLLSE